MSLRQLCEVIVDERMLSPWEQQRLQEALDNDPVLAALREALSYRRVGAMPQEVLERLRRVAATEGAET